ncbi:MAG: hypothetical protein AB2531_08905, partial [Candidatus Thiodiazotropha sp.]
RIQATRGVHLQDNQLNAFAFGLVQRPIQIIRGCRTYGARDLEQESFGTLAFGIELGKTTAVEEEKEKQ